MSFVFSSQQIHRMTLWIPEYFQIKDLLDSSVREKIFCTHFNGGNCLLSLATEEKKESEQDAVNPETGLVNGHAYAVLSVKNAQFLDFICTAENLGQQ